ncbi:MAG: hypothetical protein LEGION0398_MBIBDBAK_00351 [Legionellaceae bacterium]
MKTIFNDTKDIQLLSYIKRASELNSLNTILQNTLPKLLKGHCQLANYEKGCLSIQANNAAWGTQLRYLIPDLKIQLKTMPVFTGLVNIQYFVRPFLTEITLPIKENQKFELSTTNVECILNAAENISGKLGNALRKIAIQNKDES